MSYSIIDENLLNDQLNNEQQPVKKRDHWNEKNPHYQHPHSPETKAAISATQKARYDLLRTALEKANSQISESRVREIVRETIKEYLAKNSVPVENNNNKPIDIRL